MSLAFAERNVAAQPSVAACVRDITQKQLPPLVDAIDKGSLYPADFLRTIGAAGAFAGHTKADASVDLNPTIDAMSEVAEVCGATGFMTWCQDTLVWYIANTENDELKSALLAKTALGAQLGGTGLSNPMKSFFGIEKLKLKADGLMADTPSAGPCPGFQTSATTTCSARFSSVRTARR